MLGPIAALVLALVAPLSASATTCDLEGDGDVDNPWEVTGAEDLEKVGINGCGLDGNYLQTRDITLAPGGEAGNHTPIGSVASPFTGTYDGGGNTITGLTIYEPGQSHLGMFARSTGSIRGVHLVGISVTGDDTVGGLVGSTATFAPGVGPGVGEVVNSSTTGTVTGNRTQVGGLVGNHQGSVIRRSSSSATVSGASSTGGLVGRASGTDIEFSFATGSVSGSAYRTGGLAGEIANTTVVDSYARGQVSSSNASAGDYVGGLIGSIDTAATITRTFAANVGDPDGIVVAGGSPGGLVGGIVAATVSDSFWDTVTSGVDDTLSDADNDGRTTADMQQWTTFDTRGWDIEETCDTGGFDPDNNKVWGICPTINDGYPFLRSISVDAPSSSSSSRGTSAPSTPVRVAGAFPSMPTGGATWNRGDTLTSLTATSSAARSVTYGDTDSGVRVTVTGARGTSIATGVVADAGGELVCEVCAELAAGSVIEVWMFSEPRLVAAHRVDDLPCQRFVVPLGAPLDGGESIAAGAHTMQLAIPTTAGMEAVDIGITVGGPVPTTVPAGEGSAPATWPVVLLLGVAVTLWLAVTARRAVTIRS